MPPGHPEYETYKGVAGKSGKALYADTERKMDMYMEAGYRVFYTFSCYVAAAKVSDQGIQAAVVEWMGQP